MKDDVRAGDVLRKIGPGHEEGHGGRTLAVGPLIQDVLDISRSNLALHDVSASLAADPDLPAVLGDRVHLQQVLLNLITNAVEAIHAASERTLLIRAVRPGSAP